MSQQAAEAVFLDRRHTKKIYDNVHHNIYIDPLCLKFVDTEQFQRLRDIKQLGEALPVYSFQEFWRSELDIERSDIMTVKLAGLLHDIGHGPFSHTFDGAFLHRVLPGSNWSHEQMSAKMIDYIIDEHQIEIDPTNLKRVKEMILSSCDRTYNKAHSKKNFLFDIVANGRNGIDVDKFDYIERDCRACGINTSFQFERLMESMKVIDDEICYRAKEYLNVHKLFVTRADLFRMVYTHPKVKALELMLADALVLANSYLDISSRIDDPAEYWKLDDFVLKTIETSLDEGLREARTLILRMRRRDLYQYCNEYSVPNDQFIHYKEVTAQDIVCSQKNSGTILREEDVAVSNIKIDLTQGEENPVNRVHFFQMCGGQAMVAESQSYKELPLGCSVKLVALQGVSATGVSLKRYTPKSATG